MYNIAKKYLLLGLSLSLLIVAATFFFNQKKTTAPQTEIATKKQTKLTHIKYEGAVAVTEELDNIDDIIIELDAIQTAGTFSLTAMAQSITEEALKAFSDSDGHALPLLSHWNVGIPELTDAMNPMYMIDRIEQGEHILVSWKLDPYYADTIGSSYYEESIKKAAELQLPLVFIVPAPESALTEDSYYKNLPTEDNPNVVDINNNILDKLSPFGPDDKWKEVGTQWSSTTLMENLQIWYPNPPLVIFVSEDEADKLSWGELTISSRFSQQYPTDKDDNFKRILVGAKWIEKYRQLQNGFKEGFTESAWKNNVKFISYNKLSDNFGKSADWIDSATVTSQYINVWPLTADGVTVDFDLTGSKSDATANAPHVLVNNLDFMLKEAKRANSDIAYQLSINDDSKITDATRYRGLTQFSLWFLRPNIIRQKSSAMTRTELEPMFKEVVDSVELIHYNPQVTEFWKNGELVQNGDSYLNENIPEQYQNDPRWFLLDTDQNEPKPWSDDTNIKVWTFAIVKGEAPNREWLIYAQSPENEISNVTVSIPDYGDVVVDSKVNGSFYVLSENTTTTETITTETETIDQEVAVNPYLEVINLPVCNIDNPEVYFIKNESDWDHINDPDKRIFCVSPGNYANTSRVTLSTSGTADKPRFILLNDGVDTHPGKLSIEESANVQLYFDNASFWIVDRMSTLNIIDKSRGNAMYFYNGSSNNIINRHHMHNCYQGIILVKESNNNTIQNSRISEATLEGRKYDALGIGLGVQYQSDTEALVMNTKIINNEIYNFTDGVQLIRSMLADGTWRPTNYEGTIIDSNHIHIDSKTYTDGNGTHDVNGAFAYAENGIDLKAGSDNPSNPVIISNNYIWGYRKSDMTDSATNDPGYAIVTHFNVYNVDIIYNKIFDSANGLAASTLYDSNITGNIFQNIGINSTGYYSYLYNTNNISFKKNMFIGVNKVAKWISSNTTTKNTDLEMNIIVNVGFNEGSFDETNIIGTNYYYEIYRPLSRELNPIIYENKVDAKQVNHTFTTHKYTITPEEITIELNDPSEDSPHYQIILQ